MLVGWNFGSWLRIRQKLASYITSCLSYRLVNAGNKMIKKKAHVHKTTMCYQASF